MIHAPLVHRHAVCKMGDVGVMTHALLVTEYATCENGRRDEVVGLMVYVPPVYGYELCSMVVWV